MKDWVPTHIRKPTKLDIGKGYICTIKPKIGEPYVAEMLWVGGRKAHQQWTGDWSGTVIAWREFPEAYKP